MDAFIPATYIRSEFQKLDMYKRIAGIENAEEYADMQEEMIRGIQQQIRVCVPDLDERVRQQEEALERVSQEQTM